MLVYVTPGPLGEAACASCAALDMLAGSAAADNASFAGVEVPLFVWVAKRDASFRVASDTICLTFLVRRPAGFHDAARKGFRTL
jgi:TRAP-type C4-dicarboxylate transport system permease large subunit